MIRETARFGRAIYLSLAVCACSSSDGGLSDAGQSDAQLADVVDAGVAADTGLIADTGAAADASITEDTGPIPDSGATPTTALNILLIIADDLGIDGSRQYTAGRDLPTTPNIDALAADGVVFENAWATPACTTTRGTLISGKHGVHSGVTFVPAVLPNGTQSVQEFLRRAPETANYKNAVFGKWHLGGAMASPMHPESFGVDRYAGNLAGVIEDYSSWPLTSGGVTTTSTDYHTTKVTDLALEWIGEREQKNNPWFLWLAYVAPHSPFHLPPAGLHSRALSGTAADITANPRAYYLAAVEAMDTEIGRLISGLDQETRSRTVVIFVGDNGAPRRVIDTTVFGGDHSKGSLYEGSVRVPMIVSGAPVYRKSVREPALVNTADFFATIATLAGNPTPQIYDSRSFAHLLDGSSGTNRVHNYTEFESAEVTGWAVRNAQYKLLTLADGTKELYDMTSDLAEETNILNSGRDYSAVVAELEAAAQLVRSPL